MTETQEHEMALAIAWYEGKYTTIGAKRTAELQSLDFNEVQEKFGRLYARYEAATGQSTQEDNK